VLRDLRLLGFQPTLLAPPGAFEDPTAAPARRQDRIPTPSSATHLR
jgi:hypothetical protein